MIKFSGSLTKSAARYFCSKSLIFNKILDPLNDIYLLALNILSGKNLRINLIKIYLKRPFIFIFCNVFDFIKYISNKFFKKKSKFCINF